MKLRAITAGWVEAFALGGAVLVPLFFNPYSARIFEGDKASILHLTAFGIAVSLGLRLLLAWEKDPVSSGFRSFRALGGVPLAGFVAAFLAACAASQLGSIAPGASFRGTYDRMQGTATILACVVCAAGIVTACRSRAAIDRLVLATVFSSIPVCAYAFLQRAQLDSQPWHTDAASRATSTMGNPIFLGAWIAMVFLITLARAWTAFLDARAANASTGSRVFAWVLVLACLSQAACLYLTGSRGPLAAVVAGSAVFTCLVLLRGRHRAAIAAVLVGGAVVAGVGALSAGAIRHFTPANSNLNRFLTMADTAGGSSQVRLFIWKAAGNTVFTTEPLAVAGAGTDTLAWLRPFIGFGPETIASVIRRNYEPKLGRLEAGRYIDRCHNSVWDLLITHGAFGLAAFLALIAAGVAWAAARVTGGRFSRREALLFAAIVGGATAAGALAASTAMGLSYLGIGAGGGFVLGLLVALPFAPGASGPAAPDARDSRWPMAAGLAAALVAHLVETQFSMATVSTTLYFWIAVGLLAVEVRPAEPPGEPEEKPARTGHLAWGLMGALALVSVGFSFCVFRGTQGDWQTFLRSAWSPRVLILLASIPPALWVLSPARWVASARPPSRAGLRGILAEAAPGVIALGIGATALSLLMANLLSRVPHSYGDLLMLAGALANVALIVLAVAALLVLALGATLARMRMEPGEPGGAAAAVVSTAVLALMLWIPAQHVALMPIQADMCFKQGTDFMRRERPHDASGMYLRAMMLAPDQERYADGMAQMHAKVALASESGDEAVAAIREAVKYFEYAMSLNPSRPDHYFNVARAYAWWSGAAGNDEAGRQLALTADWYMEQGLRLTPRQHEFWEERAQLNMTLLARPKTARECLGKALELDPESNRAHELMGNLLGTLAASSAPSERAALQKEAIAHFEAAAKDGTAPNLSRIHCALASLYLALGDAVRAKDASQRALDSAKSNEERAAAHTALRAVRQEQTIPPKNER